jgi:DNA-binding beta-propeller fold protein YncE
MSIPTAWKRAVAFISFCTVLGLSGCGGGAGNVTRTSGLTKRAFVSDDIDGTLHIEDAQMDAEPGFTISTGSQPGTMALSPDKSLTLVFNGGSNTLSVISNSSESVLGTISLPRVSASDLDIVGSVQSRYVSMSDNTVGFVAIPNCPPGFCGGNVNTINAVEVLDLKTNFNVTGTVPITHVARTLVLGPTGAKLLVFSGAGDNEDTLSVIDTAMAKTTPLPAATATPIVGLDRPVSAVFSSDGTKAYVLNCGPECGKSGVSASVTVLDMTASPPVVVSTVPCPPRGFCEVPAASVGLLSGNKLFVAGTPSGTPGALAGTLSVLDTTALAPPTSSIPVSDGFHNHMELGSNNQLFIGAVTCSAGCLSMFDTSKNTATVDANTGNVSGIAPINGRNVVYVVEDLVAGSFQGLGELRIYDTTSDKLAPIQIDVVGKAVDVKYVDQ